MIALTMDFGNHKRTQHFFSFASAFSAFKSACNILQDDEKDVYMTYEDDIDYNGKVIKNARAM